MNRSIKLTALIIFLLIVFPNLIAVSESNNDVSELKYFQQIKIPIDTAKEDAKFQPIDMNIDFENNCYAKDEKNHSVRIFCKYNDKLQELESQVYDLEFISNNRINSCNIVFLTPEFVDGTEKYFVYYNDMKITSPNYEDHLEISKKNYYYEPISGQKLDISCYQIEQDEEIIYLSSYRGELFGFPISNSLIKLKPGTYEPSLGQLDQLCDLSINYGITKPPNYMGPSVDQNPSIRILVNGNLMVRYEIISTSPDNYLKTENVYTYYYNPTNSKKMIIKVHHEVLREIDIDESCLCQGSYCGLVRIKSMSNSIEELNLGTFLREVYAVDKKNIVRNYDMPNNPGVGSKEIVIGEKDNFELGSESWIGFSDSKKSLTHGLIVNSNKNVVKNNSDGFKVKAWAENELKLPGLQADTNNIYLMSNVKENEIEFRKGQTVDCIVEFFSTNEGYESIYTESVIFKNYLTALEFNHKKSTEQTEDLEKHDVTAYVHLSLNTPFGVLISAVTGRKIPYLYAELYEKEQLKSTGIVNHLPLKSLNIDLEDLDFKTLLGIFDIKNTTIFKKVVFPDIEPGEYIIKIYKKNPIFGDEGKFVGYKIIDVKSDVKTRIFCSKEINIRCNVKDQNNNKIKNVVFFLKKDDYPISEGFTNADGFVNFKLPYKPKENYFLDMYYDGFLVETKELNLKLGDIFLDKEINFKIPLSNLKIKFYDSWNIPLSVDIKPVLTIKNKENPGIISADRIGAGEYFFEDIYHSSYELYGVFKSLEFEKDIEINKETELEFIFPGEFEVDINVLNNIGEGLEEGQIILERDGKNKYFSIEKNSAKLKVPPGRYILSIILNDKKVTYRPISIDGDRENTILTNKESFLHNLLFYLSLTLSH